MKNKKIDLLNILLAVIFLALVCAYIMLPEQEIKSFDSIASTSTIDAAQAKAILEKESVYRDFRSIESVFDFELEKIDAWDVYLHKNFDIRDDWSTIPMKGLYNVVAKGKTLGLHALIDPGEMKVIDIYTTMGVGR